MSAGRICLLDQAMMLALEEEAAAMARGYFEEISASPELSHLVVMTSIAISLRRIADARSALFAGRRS